MKELKKVLNAIEEQVSKIDEILEKMDEEQEEKQEQLDLVEETIEEMKEEIKECEDEDYKETIKEELKVQRSQRNRLSRYLNSFEDRRYKVEELKDNLENAIYFYEND